MLRKVAYAAAMLAVAVVLVSLSAGQPQAGQAKKAETQQPDMVLYDRAASDIHKKHFLDARMLLETLISTYPDSEFLPKAHLALAESWYREGGAKNLAQARDEYKQTMQLYPDAPEAKEAEEMLQKIEAAVGRQGATPPQ